jgi:hypothetical protein
MTEKFLQSKYIAVIISHGCTVCMAQTVKGKFVLRTDIQFHQKVMKKIRWITLFDVPVDVSRKQPALRPVNLPVCAKSLQALL